MTNFEANFYLPQRRIEDDLTGGDGRFHKAVRLGRLAERKDLFDFCLELARRRRFDCIANVFVGIGRAARGGLGYGPGA